MNYHSSEDYFLKVEKRFLFVVGHAPYYLQGEVIKMISQNLYFKRKIPLRIADTEHQLFSAKNGHPGGE